MGRMLAGLAYGAVLAALAIVAAGAGHGTYIPMGASSAPFGLAGFQAAAFGAPILWGGVGALLHWLRAGMRARFTIAVLVIHYTSAAALAMTPAFGDWKYVRRSMPAIGAVLFTWAVVYLVGQLVIWRSLLRRATPAVPPRGQME